tara:strand:+ start:84 stop:287 length:204 start_codon:yes stop_codon:yes gene_type:complete
MKKYYFKYTVTYMVNETELGSYTEVVKVFQTMSLTLFTKSLDTFQREDLDFNIKNITDIKHELVEDK